MAVPALGFKQFITRGLRGSEIFWDVTVQSKVGKEFGNSGRGEKWE
jgi:hypothetical protein